MGDRKLTHYPTNGASPARSERAGSCIEVEVTSRNVPRRVAGVALVHHRVSQAATALHNAVLFLMTLQSFHDTIRFRKGGVGTAQKLRRVMYVWLQDHLIG